MENLKQKIFEKMLRGESIKIAHFVDKLKNSFPFSEEDKNYIQEMQKKFETEYTKKYENEISKFSEGVVLIKGEEIFGKESEVAMGSLYDDFKNGIDIVVKIPTFLLKDSEKNSENQNEKLKFYKEYQINALGIDVTFGNYEALHHKMHYLKKEIDNFLPANLKYPPFKSNIKKIEIPHFIIYLPLDYLEKLVEEFNKIKIDFSSSTINWAKIKEEVKNINLNYLNFIIYNQIFIQTNAWREKLNSKIQKTKDNIRKLEEQIDLLTKRIDSLDVPRKKHKKLEIKNKIESALINERETLLRLEIKKNSFESTENYLKLLIDEISKNEDFEEEKEEIKKILLLTNKSFAYNFISEIYFDNKKFIEEVEIKKIIEENIYLP